MHFVPGLQSAFSTDRTGIPIHAIIPIFHLECQNVVFQEFPFPHFLGQNNWFLAAVSGLIGCDDLKR